MKHLSSNVARAVWRDVLGRLYYITCHQRQIYLHVIGEREQVSTRLAMDRIVVHSCELHVLSTEWTGTQFDLVLRDRWFREICRTPWHTGMCHLFNVSMADDGHYILTVHEGIGTDSSEFIEVRDSSSLRLVRSSCVEFGGHDNTIAAFQRNGQILRVCQRGQRIFFNPSGKTLVSCAEPCVVRVAARHLAVVGVNAPLRLWDLKCRRAKEYPLDACVPLKEPLALDVFPRANGRLQITAAFRHLERSDSYWTEWQI